MAHFRSLRSTRVGQRAKAVAFVEQLWELTHALELRVAFPPVPLSDLQSQPGFPPIKPETAAQRLRRHWNIGTGPVRHLVRTMEMNGIVAALIVEPFMPKPNRWARRAKDARNLLAHRFDEDDSREPVTNSAMYVLATMTSS
jgi:hypothetical protein